MSANVFVVNGEGLTPMTLGDFPNESTLDEYLTRFPELLGSALSTNEREVRFLLIEAQAKIDDRDNEKTGRWRADLLLVDQTGTITIVEDKLSSNPEIRRKVLGQAIEYAANIVDGMTGEQLRERLAARAGDGEAALAEFLGSDSSDDAEAPVNDDFWWTVNRNLQALAIRVVFACDELPGELARSIEFLNRCTNPAEFVGVNVQRMWAEIDGRRVEALTASAVGLTERAKGKRPQPTGKHPPITAEQFFQALQEVSHNSAPGAAATSLARAMLRETGLYAARLYCTPKDGEVLNFDRHRDGLRMLYIGANRTQNGCVVSLPWGGWSTELKHSAEQVLGYQLTGKGGITKWLGEDPSH